MEGERGRLVVLIVPLKMTRMWPWLWCSCCGGKHELLDELHERVDRRDYAMTVVSQPGDVGAMEIVVAVVVFRLVDSSETGQADARLAQGQTTAVNLLRKSIDEAGTAAERLASDRTLATAVAGPQGAARARRARALCRRRAGGRPRAGGGRQPRGRASVSARVSSPRSEGCRA